MNREWWVHVLQWTLWGVAMTCIMGWVSKSRMKPQKGKKARTLCHPRSTLILGIVGFVFFGAILVFSNTIGRNETVTLWTNLVFMFFTLANLVMIAEYFRSRHVLSPEGIEYGRLFGPGGRARWEEIESVTYAPALQWFVLRTAGGSVIRISAMLTGLPGFAREVLKRVPGEKIHPTARELLKETARGEPPAIWIGE